MKDIGVRYGHLTSRKGRTVITVYGRAKIPTAASTADGHLRVDRMKGYHEAAEKQTYGKVKEYRSYFDCKGHFVLLRAEEQKHANTCAVVWFVRDVGRFDVPACPLLKQCRNQGGCEAKHKANQPHCIDPDHGCAGKKWLIGIGTGGPTFCRIR